MHKGLEKRKILSIVFIFEHRESEIFYHLKSATDKNRQTCKRSA